jgi:polyhydroxybutyrate depolymerase
VDDVAFVSAALDNVISRAAIDEDRIYVTGFSNGAGMAFRLGSDLSDRIAAIGPGSSHPQGTIGPLKRPVSMILFAGNEDPLNPFNGGIGKSPWGSQETPAFSSSFKAWADLLHCSGKPVEIYNKDGVTGSSYQGCDKGAEAQFYVVDGMGHAWAGGRSTLLKAIVGRSSDAIDETDVIWQFFVKHPRVAQQAVVAAS